MSQDNNEKPPMQRPLKIPESYAEKNAVAWHEFMGVVTRPWKEYQEQVRGLVNEISSDPIKYAKRNIGLIIEAQKLHTSIVLVEYENYIHTLQRNYFDEKCRSAGIDAKTIVTMANAALRAKKLGKPTPRQVKPAGKGKGRGAGKGKGIHA